MSTNATPANVGSNDRLGLAERLRRRTLPEHGGSEADSWAYHWNLTPGDSELHAEAERTIERLCAALQRLRRSFADVPLNSQGRAMWQWIDGGCVGDMPREA